MSAPIDIAPIRQLILDSLIIPAGIPSHGRAFDLDSKLLPLCGADPKTIDALMSSDLPNFDKANLVILYIEAMVGAGDKGAVTTMIYSAISGKTTHAEDETWLRYVYSLFWGVAT